MKWLDRVLQKWRIAKASRYIADQACVLDVGCPDGELFRQCCSRIKGGVGIDPDLSNNLALPGVRLIRGHFPQDLPEPGTFNAITMLAVLEHVPPDAQPALSKACADALKPGGHLVITVPAPTVDRVLDVLKFLHLVDGMSLEQHYGFDARQTPAIFSESGLKLLRHETFQLGLNNLFVFEKPIQLELRGGPTAIGERRAGGLRQSGREPDGQPL